LVSQVIDPIRVAFIAPFDMMRKGEVLVRELDQRQQPQERREYLIEFPGFSKVFGVRVVAGPDSVRVILPEALESEIQKSRRPHNVLADTISRALNALETCRNEFDVVLILLPDRWSHCHYGPDDDDFDLHDYLKAVTAAKGLPAQLLLQGTVISYPCRASVAWRLGIALYTKAGGVPWKLAEADPDTAFVGLSYSVRPETNRTRFVTCCSQVFDADGAGLEFVAYDAADVHVERDNPFLSRQEMRRVMSRSMALYQRRHAGRLPHRVVVHKSTEFKADEIDGCFDAWTAVDQLELVQVQMNVTWQGVRIDAPSSPHEKKGTAARYPVQRGTMVHLGGRELLLWTQGNAPAVVGGRNFYKEGKGVPGPLLLRRFAGHGSWFQGARDVLGLTKMNWNNDALYDRLPVTLGYARVLARTINRMPSLAPRAYQFRLFM
jgi:hypothetical protein